VFCKRNVFWNDVDFTRQAIGACCGLHKFLEERDVQMLYVQDEDDDAVPIMPREEAPEANTGSAVRDCLVRWVGEH
jgi:hypothetical protein